MNKKVMTFLRFAVSIILIAILFARVNFSQVIGIVLVANVILLLIGILFDLVSMLVGGICVYVFIYDKVGIKEFFSAYLKAISYGFLFPGKMGDFSLSYFLRKKVPMGELNAYSLIDKGLYFVFALGFAVILYFISYSSFITFNLLLVLFGALVLCILIVALLMFFRFRRVDAFLSKYTFGFFIGFRKSLFNFRKNWKRALLSAFFSIFRHSLITLSYFFIALAFGFYVNYWLLFLVLLVVTIVSIIPISIGGTGVRENVFVEMLRLEGYSINQLTLVALFTAFWKYTVVALILGIFALKKK